MTMRHERSFAIVHLNMNFRSFLSLNKGIIQFVMVFIEEIIFTQFGFSCSKYDCSIWRVDVGMSSGVLHSRPEVCALKVETYNKHKFTWKP